MEESWKTRIVENHDVFKNAHSSQKQHKLVATTRVYIKFMCNGIAYPSVADVILYRIEVHSIRSNVQITDHRIELSVSV